VLTGAYRNDFRSRRFAPTFRYGAEAGFGPGLIVGISCG
jgi:hypothetical protein